MNAHEIWAAAQLSPGEGIEDGAARIQALIEADHRDALRFRKLNALLQKAYDGNPLDLNGLSVSCSMLSGWRDTRQVRAELIWQDTRDEPLGLDEVLDATSLDHAD